MEKERKAPLPFLESERLIRLFISLLLFSGCYFPLLLALNAGSGLVGGFVLGCTLLLVFSVLGSLKHHVLWLSCFAVIAVAVQFILPSRGLLGSYMEAVKAISLTFRNVEATTSMFALPVALLLGSALPILCYLFSNRLAAFLPATIMVVLMLFALCTMGQSQYLWMSAPAFVAILLLISRARHDKVHLPEVLPLAIIVTVVALLILPSGRTVIEPLYDGAMDLKQRITDYLFFNEEREIFSIGDYGWYPDMESKGRMGGDVTPDENPVMMVKTDRRVLLRGISKDRYDGVDWDNTFDMARYQYRLSRYSKVRAEIFNEKLPSEALRKSAEVLAEMAINVQMMNSASSTVFAPVTLRSVGNEGALVLYFNERGELFTTHNLQADDKYTLFAPVFEGGDEALNRLMAEFPEYKRTQSADFYARYLQLPDHLEERFYQDVETITASYSSAYDKARAIVRHLDKYYRYTLTPGSAAENYDFVTYFLYSEKEGYSVHFASAMTVMCRMAGIPARYVEGFVANPSEDGFAYVTGKDARAWCEIWVEGFGWIPFDPSENQEDSTEPPQKNEPQPTPTPTLPPEDEENDEDLPTPTPEPDEPDEPENDTQEDTPDSQEPPSFPWLLLLILLLLAAAGVRLFLTSVHYVAKHTENHTDAVFIYAAAIAQLCALHKLRPNPGETPLSFAARVDEAHVLPKPVYPLWQMLTAAQYGGATLTEAAEKDGCATFDVCYRAQSLWNKLRFRFRNAFRRRPYEELTTHAVYEKPKSLYGDLPKGKANPGKQGKPQKNKQDFEPAKENQAEEKPEETVSETPSETPPETPLRRRRR